MTPAPKFPVLDCSDIAAALAFCKDKLGFDAATRGEPPTWLGIRVGRDGKAAST